MGAGWVSGWEKSCADSVSVRQAEAMQAARRSAGGRDLGIFDAA